MKAIVVRVSANLLLAAMAPAIAAEKPALSTVVVTATGTETASDKLVASVSAVSQADIELVSATHISELLSRVPGTFISRGNGQEHFVAIRSPVFTGPGGCGESFLAEDGIPLRATGFCNTNGLIEVNSEQAQRVEVLRGPGTALHGGNALHGVIDVISRAPALTPTAEIEAEGGPHDYLRSAASVSDVFGAHAVRLSINAAHDGGYKDASGFEQQKLSYRHDVQFDNFALHSLLSATNLNQETAGYILGENSYRDDHLKRSNPNPEAFRDNSAARWYGEFSFPLANDADRLTITPYLRKQDMRFLQHFNPGTPLEENGIRSAGWQSAWFHRIDDTLQTVSGINGEWTEGYVLETQFVPVASRADIPLGKHYDYRVNALNGALFSTLSWEPDARWSIQAGARLETLRYDYNNRMLAGSTRDDGTSCGSLATPMPCRFTRPADRSDVFTDYTLHGGAVYALDDHQKLLLNLGHGFRAPQATELYRLQQGQTVADLSAERVDNAELGWRAQFGSVRAEATAYQLRKSHVIFQDSDRRNIGDGATAHTGLELALWWQVSDRWDIAANGSAARNRYTNNPRLSGVSAGASIDGNTIPSAPATLGSVRLGWKPNAALRAELEWVHVGHYFLGPTDTYAYPGHNLLNLRLRHQLSPNYFWGTRLTNLSNRDYAERADYAFGNYRYFVGEPRALYVEIGTTFK